MLNPRAHLLIAASTAMLLAACGSADAGDRDAFTVRDSAGIRIAESAGPAWRDGEAWRLSDEPVLEIGMMDGPPAYQFGQIVGVIRTGDGHLIVADGQAQEARWFDADGRHVRTVGRQGGGPGEFKGLASMVRARGDTVALFDWGNVRLTYLAPDGAIAREVGAQAHIGSGFPAPQGVLDDGTMLFLRSPSFSPGSSDIGVVRNPATVVRLTRLDDEWSDLMSMPGSETLVTKTGDDGIMVRSLPFGRSAHLALAGDGFWTATSDSYEIRLHAADGTPRLIARRPVPNRPTTPAEIANMIEQRLASTSDPQRRQEVEREIRGMPLPSTMPAFAQLQVALDGHVWIREYATARGVPRDWSVFEPSGRLLGTVVTPAGFAVHEIGPDYVLGVWWDDLQVPYIRMYTLERSAR